MVVGHGKHPSSRSNPRQKKSLQLITRAVVSLLTMKIITLFLAITSLAYGQGPRPENIGSSPQPIGEAGIAWYTTWDSAKAEAKRSQRPIFFMSAAAECGNISGVF